MENNKNFFEDKYNSLDEQFNSFDDGDLYADGFENEDEDWNMDDESDVYAGGQMTAGKPASQPYIVSLYNSTGAAISDVEFLNAANSIGAANGGVTAGVVPTYDIPGKTYAEFLFSLLTQPTKIGLTYIDSVTAGQIQKSISIETANVRGKSMSDLFVPRMDPNQNQDTVVTMANQFILNGFTKLTIASIATNTTVTFSFYPTIEASSTFQLTGRAANKFGNPNIIRPLRLKR